MQTTSTSRIIARNLKTMWKIIFSDIDGTLLDKERKLSVETIEAYQRIEAHIDLVLISSRMPKGMTYFQDELKNKHLPLVCYNGGLVLKNSIGNYMDKKNILLDVAISATLVQQMGRYLEAFQVNFSVYSYDNWYTTKRDYWTKREENNTRVIAEIVDANFFYTNNIDAHKIMIMGEKEEIDTIYAYCETHFPTISLYRSKDTYIEIASKKTSKGEAVKLLLNNYYPLVAKEHTIAFGDNYNDIPLFQEVGYGVAVENGRAALKELASHVTATNKQHGVALFLNEYFKVEN